MKDSLALPEQRLLLFSVFVLSLCGIVYELVLGSLATYLLGNPVQQYSITIGFFLSSMGLGSYLSRYLEKDLLPAFIRIEAALGFVGGVSVFALSYLFSVSSLYYPVHLFMLVVIGVLVGLEIPLVTRLLRKYGALKDILSNILSLDYLGGLAGSLLFPLLLFPAAGRLLTSFIIGILNITVALVVTVKIGYRGKSRLDGALPLVGLLLLGLMAYKADALEKVIQGRLFSDDVIFSKRTAYQEIILTRSGDDLRLYLDGSIQFSSSDEYRYHEMLLFPAISLRGGTGQDILILGGGDGLAVREALKSPRVRGITLVELDPAMIALAKNNTSVRLLNGDSLRNPRVKVVIDDASVYLRGTVGQFDIVIADFPDPHDETIAKLYTIEFYHTLRRALKPGGIFVTQSTSPLSALQAFWCIHNTIRALFPYTVPYHVYIPSFGEWGFVMASERPLGDDGMRDEIEGLRYYSVATFRNALHFPKDIAPVKTEINTFNRPVLYRYYLKGWNDVMDE